MKLLFVLRCGWRVRRSCNHMTQTKSCSLYWKCCCGSLSICICYIYYSITTISTEVRLLLPRSCQWGCRSTVCCRWWACCPDKSPGSGWLLQRSWHRGRSLQDGGRTLAPETGHPRLAAAWSLPLDQRSSHETSWIKRPQGEQAKKYFHTVIKWCWYSLQSLSGGKLTNVNLQSGKLEEINLPDQPTVCGHKMFF